MFLFQNIDSLQSLEIANFRGGGCRRSRRFEFRPIGQLAGHIGEVEVRDCFGSQGAEFTSKRTDVAALGRMISIGEKDKKRLGEWVNPNRGAGPARVAV